MLLSRSHALTRVLEHGGWEPQGAAAAAQEGGARRVVHQDLAEAFCSLADLPEESLLCLGEARPAFSAARNQSAYHGVLKSVPGVGRYTTFGPRPI